MRVSLRTKMLLIALITSLVGVVLVGLFASRSTIQAYDDLLIENARVPFVATVTAYYAANGTLEGIEREISPPNNQNDNNRNPNNNAGQRLRPNNNPFVPFVLVDADGRVVISGGQFKPNEKLSDRDIQRGEPLIFNDTPIGTILLTGDAPQRDTRDEQYIATIRSAVLMGGIVAGLLAVFVGTLGAQVILRPIHDLELGIQALHTGDDEHQIPIRSNDELGDVAKAFNDMSSDLARANQLRRQMTADIAHDLRTPLGVLIGYLEAMRDDILKPTQERFDVMFGEAKQIERLTDDLRTISLADAGELPLNQTMVNIVEVLKSTAQAFQPLAEERKVKLLVDARDTLLTIDSERITQVLGNLVSNALRYTPAQGSITLAAQAQGQSVLVQVADTGAGIEADKLPHIFERFYRADSSRTSSTGETGLGLAIAKSIVEAHGGTIHAESTLGQGTRMMINLPIV